MFKFIGKKNKKNEIQTPNKVLKKEDI